MALTSKERRQRSRERARLRLQAPGLAARAADPEVPDAELSPLELAVRGFRVRVLDDLGGIPGLPLARLLQVDALATRWLIQGFLTTEVLDLGKSGRLVDRRAVRARALMHDWLKATDGYERALAAVGLDPLDLPEPGASLAEISRGIVANRKAPVSAPEPTTAEKGESRPPDSQAVEVVAPGGQSGKTVAQERLAEPVVVTPATLAPVQAAGFPDF